MPVQYKIEFVAGGDAESFDEAEIKSFRQNPADVITAYDVEYRVNNDPVTQMFETQNEAIDRMNDLHSMYTVEPIKTIISPQPEGLND